MEWKERRVPPDLLVPREILVTPASLAQRVAREKKERKATLLESPSLITDLKASSSKVHQVLLVFLVPRENRETTESMGDKVQREKKVFPDPREKRVSAEEEEDEENTGNAALRACQVPWEKRDPWVLPV